MEFNYMMLVLPCIGIAVDVITGYIAAMANGNVDSQKMKKGIYGKLGELFAIAVGFLIEFGLDTFGSETLGINADIPIAISVCAYVFLTELVSIIENIGCMNPTIGKKMVTVLGISPEKVNLNKIEGEDHASE